MEPARAIEIVQKLVDGVDPFTDERFPSISPYQQADTIRALHMALEGHAKLKSSTVRVAVLVSRNGLGQLEVIDR